MKILKNPVFVGLAILVCLNLDWELSNVKSFISGAVISVLAMRQVISHE